MLPEPYYSKNGITIYCASAEDVLPLLGEKAGLLLTDPPYGLNNWKSGGGHNLSEDEILEVSEWDNRPSQALMDAALASADCAIVWGGNYLGHLLGSCRAPLIWNKGFRGLHLADGEMAWTNFDFGTLRILDLNPASSDARGARQHPTQKPTALMRWCIEQSGTTGTVLDPFMGSGTTLRAAKDLGRPATGIEIREEYCAVAVQRLGQEVFDFST